MTGSDFGIGPVQPIRVVRLTSSAQLSAWGDTDSGHIMVEIGTTEGPVLFCLTLLGLARFRDVVAGPEQELTPASAKAVEPTADQPTGTGENSAGGAWTREQR
ncbi:hypothetical protein M8C13_18095 [Crossiella sp. SN42]|uniref:hypothetical protein n=1 Tax=Crossiella sp. SN42 TaxID=2944808 RepID=UPI00207CDB5D|nr:hypothetical protein [Crossiella sp. SN42]MCO1577671.1 hypothetical protein [Crossiella sp. SN42]